MPATAHIKHFSGAENFSLIHMAGIMCIYPCYVRIDRRAATLFIKHQHNFFIKIIIDIICDLKRIACTSISIYIVFTGLCKTGKITVRNIFSGTGISIMRFKSPLPYNLSRTAVNYIEISAVIRGLYKHGLTVICSVTDLIDIHRIVLRQSLYDLSI